MVTDGSGNAHVRFRLNLGQVVGFRLDLGQADLDETIPCIRYTVYLGLATGISTFIDFYKNFRLY